MSTDLTISVDEILAAMSRVLSAVERQHGEHIRLNGDEYWNLPVTAAFDMTKSDPAMTVGTLTDDVEARARDANQR